MRPGLQGVDIDTTIFRPATFIEQSVDNLTRALLIGIALVILIIAAFLFDWRTAFISLIAIPLSLIAAILVLELRDTTINVMVLAGLVVAIGVVVDDAIIDVENIVRRLRQARAAGSDESTFSIVLNASVEVRSAITYATLINVVAIVPIFFLEGLSGSFFAPLALSYGLAVLVSMVVALTVTPALCLVMLSRGRAAHRESPLLRWLKRGYGAVLARVIRRPSPAILTALALILAGLFIFPTLGASLLPNFKERDFLMHWLTQPGTGAEEERRVSIRACRDLREIPGVRNCGSHIGQAQFSDEVYGVDFGENWVSVDPKVDYDKTLASIHRTVEGYPGLYRDVQTYLRERIKEVLTGTSESVVVRVSGPDLAVLEEKANDVEKAIGGVPGLVDAHADLLTTIPHIEVEVDLAAARRFGLKPGDVRRQTSTLIASEEVADLFYGGQAYDVHVWSIPSARSSLSDVQRLPIDTPDGGRIRLEQVADVRVAPTPNAIERQFQTRRIDVGGNLEGRDLAAVVDDVEERARDGRLPARVQRRGARRVDGAQRRAEPAAAVRRRGRARDPAAPARGVPQPPARAADLPAAADGAGGRRAGRMAGRRRAVARLARGLPDRVRHRRAQRDPDDQPFPAPGAPRGGAARAGARAARRPGAARADPHDGARDRPRPRPAGHRRQHPRARDRASDGDGHPRRAGHRDAAQPVRAAVAVPALREAHDPPVGRGRRAGRHGAGTDRRLTAALSPGPPADRWVRARPARSEGLEGRCSGRSAGRPGAEAQRSAGRSGP